jgi:hypothetical protein
MIAALINLNTSKFCGFLRKSFHLIHNSSSKSDFYEKVSLGVLTFLTQKTESETLKRKKILHETSVRKLKDSDRVSQSQSISILYGKNGDL